MGRLLFRSTSVSMLILIVVCVSYSYADEKKTANPYVKSYPFESAVINYSKQTEYGHGYIANAMNILYIKGDRSAQFLKGSVPNRQGKIERVETLRIITPEYIYTIDLAEKTGTKVDNPTRYTRTAYENLSDEEREAFHERMERRGITSLNVTGMGEKTDTDTFLGYECDVYQSGDPDMSIEELLAGNDPFYMKSWVWRDADIPLKIVSRVTTASTTLTATNIKTDVEIPESKFTVPDSIEVTYDEVASEFAKQNAMSGFNVLKTGKPLPVRVQPEKRELTRE